MVCLVITARCCYCCAAAAAVLTSLLLLLLLLLLICLLLLLPQAAQVPQGMLGVREYHSFAATLPVSVKVMMFHRPQCASYCQGLLLLLSQQCALQQRALSLHLVVVDICLH